MRTSPKKERDRQRKKKDVTKPDDFERLGALRSISPTGTIKEKNRHGKPES